MALLAGADEACCGEVGLSVRPWRSGGLGTDPLVTAAFDTLLLLAPPRPSALAVAPSAPALSAALSAATEPEGGAALLTREPIGRGVGDLPVGDLPEGDLAEEDEYSPLLRLRLIASEELNFATAIARVASAATSEELRSSDPTIARTLVGRSVSPLALCQSILIWCERGTTDGSGTPAMTPGESRSAPAETPLPGASGEPKGRFGEVGVFPDDAGGGGGSPFGVGGVRPKKPRVGERRDGMRTGWEPEEVAEVAAA